MLRYILIIPFIFCLLVGYAQQSLPDTTTVANQDDAYGIFEAFKGTPGKAGLYSLIIPGAGQVYNKKWVKAPIFLAAEGIAIGVLIYNIDVYNRWDTDYKLLASGQVTDVRGLTSVSTVRSYRDSARQNKDYAWIGLVAVHIIAAADAFVDRHLIEFDVKDDIGVSFSPVSPYPGLNLTVSF